MGIAYRREIDGLRAIAVGAVVLFHAGIGGAGFVGVDVFFVISGYLITGILLREQAATGRIDLLAFFARRVRRIFPAGVFVVLVTLGLSALLLDKTALAQVANSAAAASVFGANLFFQAVTGDYFGTRAEELPLLHLWSLAVEEQFYFVWPALLVLAHKRLVPALVGLGLASLALSEWLTPNAAFYQMPARFWELAAGGILAAMPARTLPRGMVWAGLALTLAACIVPVGHFPGIGALPAVLGAVLVLAGIHGGQGNALLASRPFVWTGLISYSLYLWHWPLLALYRATSVGPGSTEVRLQLCAVAVLLAFASYRYIEQPFRRMAWPKGRMVAAGASVSCAVALSAYAYGYQVGRVEFVDDGDRTLAILAENGSAPRPIRCHYGPWDYTMPLPGCTTHPEPATVATWGDSTAESWAPLAWELAYPHRSATTLSYDACPPLQGWAWEDRKGLCAEFNARAAAYVRGMDTLILSARWGRDAARGDIQPGLHASLALVAPYVRRVVIVGPTPEMPELVPRCIRAGVPCQIPRAEFDKSAAPILALLRAEASRFPNVEVLDPTAVLCDASACPGVREGVALYWDSLHMSSAAATMVAIRHR